MNIFTALSNGHSDFLAPHLVVLAHADGTLIDQALAKSTVSGVALNDSYDASAISTSRRNARSHRLSPERRKERERRNEIMKEKKYLFF